MPASPAAPVPLSAGHTQSLYRKYRPQSFDVDELVGQEHVVRTLRNAIALGRVAHAYLFCGPRGTGKTTTARLLAKAVNCLHPDPKSRPCNACANCQAIASGSTTDIIEIDAASNRGIDDIRDLRERVKYAPTQLQTKFYIIDEAHQITGAAANAFLKTLEEPPAHTKFVLATTDPEELLPTIVSRCQRFDFRRIHVDAIVARLRAVADAEHIAISDDSLRVIARHASGSLRDALGLLDQLAVYGEERASGQEHVISVDDVLALLGVSRNDRVETLVMALAKKDVALALRTVNAAVEAGEDARQLNRQLVAYLRVLMHARAGESPDADERARELASHFDVLELAELARLFSETDYRIRHAAYHHLPLEIALVEGILRRPESAVTSEVPRVQREAPQAPPAGADGAPSAPPRAPVTTLRDRVRGAGAPPSRPPSEPPAPAQHQDASPVAAGTGPATGTDNLSVEQIAELWPRIRLEVKAINRRIEALLSSVDPYAVQGDDVLLVTAYAFHRDRLNADEVRAVVEEVISRIVHRRVRVSCMLRGEASAIVSAQPTPIARRDGPTPLTKPSQANPAGGPAAPVEAQVPQEQRDEERIAAAKNIFDAEEIPS
ncbi:MAG: DNA polymerase III subunit gamma/tau [Chloroflexota bacterium]